MILKDNKTVIVISLVGLFLLLSFTSKANTLIDSKYFDLSEFDSKDGAEFPAEYLDNLQELVRNLDIIREDIGAPLIVNSGYRSIAHNADIGGEDNSYHLKAMAADIKSPNYTPLELWNRIRSLQDAGKIVNGGLGIYNTFIHYDIGPKRRWDNRTT